MYYCPPGSVKPQVTHVIWSSHSPFYSAFACVQGKLLNLFALERLLTLIASSDPCSLRAATPFELQLLCHILLVDHLHDVDAFIPISVTIVRPRGWKGPP
ncbi:hypothetical protein MRX96_024485 [Rhipicephalus microplus]